MNLKLNFHVLFKPKEYHSYYEKLSFMDQIDLNDLEKMFNYADLYPTANELKEAKDNVLKCNK